MKACSLCGGEECVHGSDETKGNTVFMMCRGDVSEWYMRKKKKR